MRELRTVTFVYETREDRLLAAINAGLPEAWSCWLTRRIALALLERAAKYVVSTSVMAQHAPAELRGEFADFEHEAAIASTAGAMTNTPPDVLKASMNTATLADRVTLSNQGDRLRLELHGKGKDGAAGTMTRAELQRILQMLRSAAVKAGWITATAAAEAAATSGTPGTKQVRH